MQKQELAREYNISGTTLRALLNDRYYELLKNVGYRKTDQLLSPRVVRKFKELYGNPL